jgi:hypothetical protein
VRFLNEVGAVDTTVSADTPLYAVFRKGGKRTYVVANANGRKQTVAFSDGKVMTTDKPGVFVGSGTAK